MIVLHPKEMRSRITAKGEKIIAFSVSDEEYQCYIEHFREDKKYTITLKEWFNDKTFNQRGYFHAHIRMLANKMHMNFDEMKLYVLTEDGIEDTAEDDGMTVQKTLWVKKEFIPDVKQYVLDIARKEHFYLRNDYENTESYGFRVFKGISMMDSQEMSIVIDRLIDRCNDAGVATISAEEYKRLKG